MAKTRAKRLPDIVALIALCATCWLAIPASEADAATNPKQRVTQPAKKPEARKQEAKKPEVKPAAKKTTSAKPAREAAGRKASPKKTAHGKAKPVKQAAKAKRGKKPA